MIQMTQERVKNVLDYDPLTGIFRWKIKPCISVAAGDVAGGLSGIGYVRIKIDNKEYLAHRLAFIYMLGYAPKVVDHINMIRHDNRWINLRPSSHATNQHNTRMQKNNTSGVKGVMWHKKNKKWQVSIRLNGKLYYFGQYYEIEEAERVAINARENLHGDFARHE